MKRLLYSLILSLLAVTARAGYDLNNISVSIGIKQPGCRSVRYPLSGCPAEDGTFTYRLKGQDRLPLLIYQKVTDDGNCERVTLFITALEDVYFNYGQTVNTGFAHSDCQFYMPGFWYRRNQRSSDGAPSFRVSDSWTVREDRLSSPMTAIFDEVNQKVVSVSRIVPQQGCDALVAERHGDVILSGTTTLGYTGFANIDGKAHLSFGFPYKEEPRSYVRKLTLDPSIEAYQFLPKGESVEVTWELHTMECADYSECIIRNWEYCYDLYKPQPVATPYTPKVMKKTMSNFFRESYVGTNDLKFFSGLEIDINTCRNSNAAEVGFIGRTLLNAFNALEYAEETGDKELADMAVSVFDSYLEHGISDCGLFKEFVRMNAPREDINSIRRQSEGVYAVLHYLNYEKKHGRMHREWEACIRKMLDIFLKIQHEDGSFSRKFRDDFSVADESGGSTPSATLPLVMGYKYFKDKRYLEAAKRSVAYLDREIISKADYFSSTLDANCEDKEASLYASTAAYYLALTTTGKEHKYYASLARKAAYFALSWYYTWDVPFAKGQMLGDVGLKSRGWGNVSVENNHIDVFVFDFADVLRWLADEYDEKRFSDFAQVITTSMCQLLPHEGHMCGVGKEGYYPEVVQHTAWDYGTGGKGFYNYIFAPGWTVASLWELFSPGRAEDFLK